MKILAVLALIAGSLTWLTWPAPLPEYKGADCIVPKAIDPRLVPWHRAEALRLARKLREKQAVLHGAANRIGDVWYGLSWNAYGILKHVLGIPAPEPTFTSSMEARAQAAVFENALLWDAAKGLNRNICYVQQLIPQVRADSIASAETKLSTLIPILSDGWTRSSEAK
jgi:hypothetical protein